MSISSRSWRRVSCKGPGSGSARARVSRMLVMYSALKAWKASPSEMARATAIGGVDLGQGQDLAGVVASVEPVLLDVIGCRIWRQRQEVHHQALFAGPAALGDQTLGVVRLLDVLVPTIAARVTGDELVVEVDADPVGIGFDRQSAVSECGGDGILIGVQGDSELAGGDTGRSVCKVVGVRVERSQMRTLLRKQIDGSLLRFAVDAHVGDGIEPDLCGRVNRAEVGQFEPVQEILFDVART